MRWIPNNKLIWTTADLEIKYKINSHLYKENMGIYKIIWKDRGISKLIGEIGLFPCLDSASNVEIGYILHELYWKNGFATELLLALEDFIRQHLPHTSIRAQLFEHNINSKRLLERCSYQCIASISISQSDTKLVYNKSLA